MAEAFESGAQGLLELMVNTADVTPATAIEVACEADDVGTFWSVSSTYSRRTSP
jgi:SHS2 domain-containing protein